MWAGAAVPRLAAGTAETADAADNSLRRLVVHGRALGSLLTAPPLLFQRFMNNGGLQLLTQQQYLATQQQGQLPAGEESHRETSAHTR